ncbi:SocA family protein [Vibrio sp. MMG022]|uniref:Panacea domain-containing protein n=1 Tax=Vibrio TaxID=662 RepID=UPI001F2BFEB1|nr:Panacea domain-containing protein [Vibrio sp. MMG023]MCF6451325.1 SocA family protein [Vibrio sp. MMG023]CAH1563171.1 conserved hypothetical protein [Vibrio owensii]
MNNLQRIVAYLCCNYPYGSELSKARLTKLVYLADWFSALADERTLTDIEWVFNHYGPYVDDVVDSVSRHNSFNIERTQTMYGSDKWVISYDGDREELDSLDERTKEILNLVITNTQTMYFNSFIDYVYSTYPVRAQNRYAHLDLVELANEYLAQETEA